APRLSTRHRTGVLLEALYGSNDVAAIVRLMQECSPTVKTRTKTKRARHHRSRWTHGHASRMDRPRCPRVALSALLNGYSGAESGRAAPQRRSAAQRHSVVV